MKQIVQGNHNGKIQVVEVPASRLGDNQLLVKTAVSVISNGTELAMARNSEKSLLEKALKRPEVVGRVIDQLQQAGINETIASFLAKLNSVTPLGYSCAGTVVDIGGVSGFRAGDRVACAGAGYASHAEYVTIPKSLCAKVPDGVSLEEASLTTLGAIGLQGVRIADVRLGESVAVIGLGMIGLITVQLLKAAGCRVAAIDINPLRVEKAAELGADLAIQDSGAAITAIMGFTQGRGADAVIVTAATQTNLPTELAGKLVRLKGRVVFVGDVKMDIPRVTYYRKEVDIRMAMSYGPGRYDPSYEEKGLDYPYAYVPFTEQRNMETFLALVKAGRVTPAELISHRFNLDQAEAAYNLIAGKTAENYLGVVFRYSEEANAARRVFFSDPVYKAGRLALGVIGAGGYAKEILLPMLKKQPEVRLVGIATSTGLSGRYTGERFGFNYCSTDYREILLDSAIEAVIIATRHDSHASLTVDALKAGKHVFVEKPLALTDEQLAQIINSAQATGRQVVVGLNRRFSPLAQAARRFFAGRAQPLAILYRVNAGALAPEHWLGDMDQGGRIIGEICHFIDFMQYITGAKPREVYASALRIGEGWSEDTITATFSFDDGSLGTVHYYANGDKALLKEYIEIYGEGKVFTIKDFRKGYSTQGGKTITLGSGKQDKGQRQLVDAFCNGVLTGNPAFGLNDAVYATLASFRTVQAIRSGKSIPI